MKTIMEIMPRRLAYMLVPVVLASGALVASTTAAAAEEPEVFTGRDDLRRDRSVAVEPVTPDGPGFIDPSAEQVWRPETVAATLPGPATAVFDLDAWAAGATGPAPNEADSTGTAGLPVSVRPVFAGPGFARFAAATGPVTVEMADAEATRAAGVDGVLLSVTSAATGPVELAVDYAAFADRYGAGWGSRLQLVELPACALTTPEAAECLIGTPVESDNQPAQQQVSTRVRLAGESTPTRVFAATAATGSDSTGDYRATDLSPAGSWTAGGGDGGFSYSYPLRLPPAEGPVPTVALGYASASHDGRTSGTNNQASWVGDGWGYEPGFVERSYRPCGMDDAGSHNNPARTGDLCWDADGAHVTLSLNGTNTTLVRDDASGQWRAQADANWRIELLGSRATPGSATSERWRVTTTDGTQYFFASEAAMSNSRLTVPVFGNHAGEPCRASAFKDSSCRQGYRWLLDKVVDVHGNLARYFYATETGHYGAAGDPQNRVSYHRAGRLLRIEYGLRDGGGTAATARVVFTTADRCLSDCGTPANPTEENWPDTPWDLHCAAAPCTSQLSPAFFATKRLTGLRTQVRDGSEFRDVASWTLDHEFKDYGDADQAVLWLKSIQHSGEVGGTVALPKVEFGGEALPNRVDAVAGVPVMWRWRLSSIKTETGAVITATYSAPQCSRSNLPANVHTNSMRCYPVRWTPEFFTEPVQDWFHKYVVTSVVETDTTTGMPAVETNYEYSTAGGGTPVLWAFDDSEFAEDEHRTYNQWRGYAQVTTLVGDPAEGQTRTRARFYRGLDDQPLPSGGHRTVNVIDAEGNTATDHEAMRGQTWETLRYDGSTMIDGTTWRYWTRRTATRNRDHDGGALKAWFTRVSVEHARTRLVSSTWQRSELRTAYDSQGRAVRVNSLGDSAQSVNETCLRTEYADDSTAWIREAVSRTEVVGVACDTSPSRPRDLISETRHYFDGSATHGAGPTRGLTTRVDVVDSWSDGPAYATIAHIEYDALGRPVAETDALGRTTTTAYTPAGAGPVTRTVTTNPLGHRTRVDLEPAWGQQTALTDPNGRITVLNHDALGRTSAVWLPGRAYPAQTASLRFAYHVRDDGPVAVTTQRLNHVEEYVTTVVLYDALLRERQTQQETADRGRLLTETLYDTHGRVDEKYGPDHHTSAPDTAVARVREAESAARVAFHYDRAGRMTEEVFYNKHVERWRTTTSYGGSSDGFLITVRHPHGAPATATLTNAHGESIEERTYRSNAPTGPYDALTYRHDPAGRVVQMTDQANNQWSWEFDLRGDLIAAHDPDAGTTSLSYDAAGQLVSSTDARGVTVVHNYDELGRKVTRHDGDGTLLAEWEYDTVPGGLGMLGRSVRWADGQAYERRTRAFDPAGRPTQTTVTLPAAEGRLGGSYWFTQSYYPDGKVAMRGYDAAGNVEGGMLAHEYDHVGNPTRLVLHGDETGTTVIVDDATFTPFGEVQTRRLGAGDTRHAYHGFVYEEGTRRLERATFDREASLPAAADLRYTYDDSGNLLSVADVPEGLPANQELRCYQYDSQRRLTDAWSQQDTDGCSPSPSMSALGGPAPYWNSYAHDRMGNRTSETLRRPGEQAVSRTYSYPAGGQSQPHAVQAVTTVGGAERSEFVYDAAGNTVRRDSDGVRQFLRWDTEGRLATVELDDVDGELRMVYDAEGNRLLRDDGGSVTAYLPETELSWDPASDTLEGARYFSHAGEVVAVCTGQDVADWVWLGVDRHGTATHSVNAFTGVEQVRHHDPYGNPRGEEPASWPGQQTFVGGVTDQTGLVQMGARYYDPSTGRFLSVDPILLLDDDQQINGYAYAYNNPTSFSDPTGLTAGCPPAYCRSRPPTPKPRTPGCPAHWCKSKVPGKTPDRPNNSTVHYRNGTTVTEYDDGRTAINDVVLGPGHPDPYEMAEWIDEQIGSGGVPDVWLAEALSDDPTRATAQLIEARCRVSRLDSWDDFCSQEFHSWIRGELGYDRGGTVAACASGGAYLGPPGGTLRVCIGFDSEGVGALIITDVGGGPFDTNGRYGGGFATAGLFAFSDPMSELNGCGAGANAVVGRGLAIGGVGMNVNGSTTLGAEIGYGVGASASMRWTCTRVDRLVTW